LTSSFEAARIYGTVVSIKAGGTPDLGVLDDRGLSFHAESMVIPLLEDVGREHHGEILEKIVALADQGRVRPLIDEQRFTFSNVADAHRRLESGGAIGKVVLSQGLAR